MKKRSVHPTVQFPLDILTDVEHPQFQALTGKAPERDPAKRAIALGAALSLREELRMLTDPDVTDRDKLVVTGRMVDRAGYTPTHRRQVTLTVEIAPDTLRRLERGYTEVEQLGIVLEEEEQGVMKKLGTDSTG
jgi:hypothetical protein